MSCSDVCLTVVYWSSEWFTMTEEPS